ncbi:MAG: tetratricopeptide repeat protein, partial [Cytophagia bacterium]
ELFVRLASGDISSVQIISRLKNEGHLITKEVSHKPKENEDYLSKKQNNLEKEIKCIALLGDSYAGQSDFSLAISFYIAAIKKAEANNRPDLAAKSYNGLGVVAYQRGDYEKAKQYFLQAAQLKLDAGLVDHYAMIMTNLSGVFFSLGKYDEALFHLQQALPEIASHDAVLAAAYNSIGSIYQMGYQQLDSAQYYYNRSIEVSEKGGFKDVLISAYHNQGEIYLQQKNFNAGISLLKKLFLFLHIIFFNS